MHGGLLVSPSFEGTSFFKGLFSYFFSVRMTSSDGLISVGAHAKKEADHWDPSEIRTLEFKKL